MGCSEPPGDRCGLDGSAPAVGAWCERPGLGVVALGVVPLAAAADEPVAPTPAATDPLDQDPAVADPLDPGSAAADPEDPRCATAIPSASTITATAPTISRRVTRGRAPDRRAEPDSGEPGAAALADSLLADSLPADAALPLRAAPLRAAPLRAEGPSRRSPAPSRAQTPVATSCQPDDAGSPGVTSLVLTSLAVTSYRSSPMAAHPARTSPIRQAVIHSGGRPQPQLVTPHRATVDTVPIRVVVSEEPQDYQRAWDRQRAWHEEVVAGAPDLVWLLEHESVYTAGRRTEPLERPFDGTPVIDVDRGGKITWHGPGQLVGYPIVRLPDPVDVVAHVRRLEGLLIDVCAELSVPATRVPGRSGVWVLADDRGPDRKVAAIGVRVARGVTLHGFALNADPDLTAFDRIVPCGIRDASVTSLSAELGRDVTVAEVRPLVVARVEQLVAEQPTEAATGATAPAPA